MTPQIIRCSHLNPTPFDLESTVLIMHLHPSSESVYTTSAAVPLFMHSFSTAPLALEWRKYTMDNVNEIHLALPESIVFANAKFTALN